MSDKVLTALEKYFPIVANVNILLIHEFWQTFTLDIRAYTSILLGCAVVPLLILIGYSKKHHFCFWHRLLLLNLMIHGVLFFADKVITMLNYEFIDIFFVTLRLTQIAIVLATFMYFWNIFNLTEIYGRFTTGKKRTKASHKGH